MKVFGTKYQTPCVLVIGKNEDDDLLFGSVQNVLVYGQEVYFEFEQIEAIFCQHYHAYALSLPILNSSQHYLIKQKDLVSYHPYGFYHCLNISNMPSLHYTVLRSNIYIP